MNKLGLKLSLDDIDEIKENEQSQQILKCYSSDKKEKESVEAKLKLFEDKNNSVKNKCDDYGVSVNTSGSSGTIYESDDDKYIKFSDLPLETSKLFDKSHIFCNTLEMKMDKSINENKYSLNYSKLSKIFPLQIMKIYSTSECKNDNQMFSNVIEMEKVSGITMKDFLTNLDLKKSDDKYNLISCVLQLIYITIYANSHGFVHNDLTTSNIIVYEYNDPFELNELKINDKIINMKFNNKRKKIFVPKLIDFSYSTHISKDKLSNGNKIIFGETKQVISIIINKLRLMNKNCEILNHIDNLINSCIEGTELMDYFLEMEVDMSTSNGYRLLNDKKIIELAFDSQIMKKKINLFLINLFKLIKTYYPEDFDLNLTNYVQKINVNNANNENEGNKENNVLNIMTKENEMYLKKYLKYKNKYLQLKSVIKSK